MKDIKFRAWSELDKKMYQCDMEEDIQDYFKHNDGITLMQYIGLKDKNDKEIYEDDYNIDDGFLFLVSFKNRVFGYKIYCRGESGKWVFSEFVSIEDYYADEIDFSYNIHENPELLED